MMPHVHRSGVFLGLLLLAIPRLAPACGGASIETVLDHPRSALQSPPAGFWDEVTRIDVPPSPLIARLARPAEPPDPHQPTPDTLDVELADLGAHAGIDAVALADYGALREIMQSRYAQREGRVPDDRTPPPEEVRGLALLEAARRDEWPAGLPGDVQAYLRGALRYLDGDETGALAAWRDLMTWREEDRPNRSTWTAWMLAKTTRPTAPEESERWYRETVRLAQAGFRDPLRLGRYAAGWLARVALQRGERREALTIYANQALSGDPFGWSSLRQAMPPVNACSDADLAAFAADPFLRRLVTAGLLRARSPEFYGSAAEVEPEEFLRPVRRWIAAMEAAEIDLAEEAERVAWMAYQLGDFETCARWLARTPEDAPVANSLRGKLALLAGRVDEASRFFDRAAEKQSPSPDLIVQDGSVADAEMPELRAKHALADDAVVDIARRRYAEALEAFLRAGYPADSAYVAERLLSTAELVRFTNAALPREPDFGPRLADLTARRLAREGHLRAAEGYFPADWRPAVARYREKREAGEDRPRPPADRAAAWWDAAQMHRALGERLFATSDYPDIRHWRRAGGAMDLARLRAEFARGVGRPVPGIRREELLRATRHRTRPEKRYHYRFVAADLAWQAAALMPDDSEQTARVLGIAGNWIKYDAPSEADRFYKAMIWRNWSTPLARTADQRRWLPAIPWNYDPFVEEGLPKPDDFY